MLRRSALDLFRLIAGESPLQVIASLLIGLGVFGIFAGRTGPVEFMMTGYLALLTGIALGSWARGDLYLGPLWIVVLPPVLLVLSPALAAVAIDNRRHRHQHQ
jgi:hypothetical protein